MISRQHVNDLLKSYVRRSSSAQSVYSYALTSLANWNRRKGRTYVALRHLCTAHRRLANPTWEEVHLRQIVQLYRGACFKDRALMPHSGNTFYKEFVESDEARAIRKSFASEPLEDRVRLRRHRDDGDLGRQGNLMILKAPNDTAGERGVMILKYNDTFAQFAAVFDLSALLRQYRIVLEPSYSRNFEESLFLLCGADAEVVLTSRCAADHEFVHRAELNFESVWLGASDWVDHEMFVPLDDKDRDYDVAMVAAWSSIKRHSLLFQSIAALHPRRLRLALVGYPLELTRRDIEHKLHRYGVQGQCDVFENISAGEVASILARSKVAVHLSKQEGTNKATFEALCCDTPLVVYRHNVGFPMEAINSRTGVLAEDHDLSQAIEWMVDNHHRFRPRQWVLSNTGYAHATRHLNDSLKRIAIERREPWTHGIASRVNLVNPRYRIDADRDRMESAYQALSSYLIC